MAYGVGRITVVLFLVLALIGGPLLAILLHPILCDIFGAMCGEHGVNHSLLTIILWGCFSASMGRGRRYAGCR